MAIIVDVDTPLSFVTSNFTSYVLGLYFAGLLNGEITSLSKITYL
jgi:hypothetical protein